MLEEKKDTIQMQRITTWPERKKTTATEQEKTQEMEFLCIFSSKKTRNKGWNEMKNKNRKCKNTRYSFRIYFCVVALDLYCIYV